MVSLALLLVLNGCGGGGDGALRDPFNPTGPPNPNGTPGAFQAALFDDVVGMQFTLAWNPSSGAARYRVSLKRTSATDFELLNDNLSAATTEFHFDVGLVVEWDAALFRVEACNALGCTAAPDLPLQPERSALLSQKEYLKSSMAKSGDFFGAAVATSADGNTLAVGAPMEDGDGSTPDSGTVRVYVRAGTTWSLQATLTALNVQASDQFAASVALSADGNTLAVGAPFEGGDRNSTPEAFNNNAPRAGAVYVFTRDAAGAWDRQHAYLKASNAEGAPPGNLTDGDQFGTTLRLSADGTTLVVGAAGEDGDAHSVVIAANANADATNNFAPNAGAAYVFTRSGSNTWTQRAYLKASNAETLDNFAEAVAVSTDGSTIAVGAYQEDGDAANTGDPTTDNNNLRDSGAVYVFLRRGDVWEQQSYLKAPRGAPRDWFGWSLALSGSGDTLAIGAPFEAAAGAAHIFTRNGTQWSLQSDVAGSNASAADQFGTDVSLASDGRTLAVGAPFAFVVTGAAYVYVQVGTTWKEQGVLRQNVADGADQFGARVAVSGDGRSVFFGAPGESGDAQSTDFNPNNNAERAGAVYEF
jgi:hypothetical protein